MKEILIILQNALSYGGDMSLSVINYLLLCVVVMPFVASELKEKTRLWWLVFTVAFVLQVSFWFVLKVQGISIIWNALLGFLILCLFRLKTQLQIKTIGYFSVGAALVANLYFALRFPLITSIAHASALVLGMLFHLALKLNNSRLSFKKV